MSEWDYIETESFIRSSEKIKVSDLVKDSIKEWSKKVKRQQTPRNKRVFVTSNNTYEIWIARIGNPDANQGKSGGYRLSYYVHVSNNQLSVDLIEVRSNLDFKGSRGKGQKKWDAHLVELKKNLTDKSKCV